MSEDIFKTEKYVLTRYWGGKEKGRCLQITILNGDCGFVQLTSAEVRELAEKLLRWLKIP